MDELRKPLFVAALALALLIVLVETGSNFFTAGPPPSEQERDARLGQLPREVAENVGKSGPAGPTFDRETPPGLAILTMAVLDGLLLFSVGMMGASFVLTDRVVGRLQGVVSLVVSITAITFAFFAITAAITKVLVMVGLFTAAPFGTIAYMVVWGSFDRGGATGVLSLLLMLKLGFAACLVLAHQRFLQNKGLVLMILCSLLANLIIGFLHNLVPIFLVSITDAIGAIIIVVLALVWAVLMLIGAVSAVIKAVV